MLAAEDGRPLTREQAAPLLSGAKSASAGIQRMAARALGRLEDPQFAADIAPLLTAESADVRAEAANALGQIAAKQTELPTEALLDRLSVEQNAMVRGVLCETLGRLPYAGVPDMQRVEAVLVGAAQSATGPGALRVGAIKGLEALVRRGWSRQFRAAKPTIDLLIGIAAGPSGAGTSIDQLRARRMAMLALNAGRVLGDVQLRAQDDADPQVRRLAIVAAVADGTFERRAAMVERALKDPDAMVRYEGLRAHGRHLATVSCVVELRAVNDSNPHVSLLAIDLLGASGNCPTDRSVTPALVAMARSLQAPASTVSQAGESPAAARAGRLAPGMQSAWTVKDWHTPAHAIVSLARRAPAEARLMLPGLVMHPVWQVRMYAARAADVLNDAETLTTLSADRSANVREAALAALVRVKGRGADPVLVGALDRPAYQVVMQAARGLKGTPLRADATRALLSALAVISAERRETSRDPRLALLERIQELADPQQAPALEPYLGDFDPAVAKRAADILSAWSGTRRDPVPGRPAGAPAPTPEDVDALPPGIRITITGGRSFDVRFFIHDTPISAWRVMRLVKSGYYNGLTFHRILPGFIIQGGSPDANEFVGDGPFMRDELGLQTNARGTVGTSTRGRDTGDAQFYVNTVDNPRLDHEYTVFGEITRGLEVVDLILEGDAIARIEPLPRQVPGRDMSNGASGGGL